MALALGTNCGLITATPANETNPVSSVLDTFTCANGVYQAALKVTTGSDAVNVTELGFYNTNWTVSASGCIVGIFSNSTDRPGSVLYATSEVSLNTTANRWVKITGLSFELAASTTYWLVVTTEASGDTTIQRETISGSTFSSRNTTPDTMNFASAVAFAAPTNNVAFPIYGVYEIIPSGVAPDEATGHTISVEQITLSWDLDSLATSYDLYIKVDDSDFESSDLIYSGADAFYVYGTISGESIEVGTTYYWRVDTVNDYGTTTGSVQQFTLTDAAIGTGSGTFNPLKGLVSL